MIIILLYVMIVLIMCLVLYYLSNSSQDEKVVIHPYLEIEIFNKELKNIDNSDHLVDASLSNVKTARLLDSALKENHQVIKKEIKSLLKNGYSGLQMSDFDQVQRDFLKGSKKWSCLWIKFIDTYAGTSDLLPTLKRIVKSLEDDIILLHVSILWPGGSLPLHRGVSKSVWRYHYGISIPTGDIGLEVEGKIIRWKEKEGFLWDDTLEHRVWNNTDQARLIIFADIQRNMTDSQRFKSIQIHKKIQDSEWIKEIQDKLKKEGIRLD
jgi:aspartyl/asparaginyl beta-hydroxylase (cupin superfamily)